MSLAQLIPLAIKASLVMSIFSAGLRTRHDAVLYLFRHPSLFARSVLAMNILMPLIALWIAVVFRLHPAVRTAFVALAISPVPPFLPGKLLKANAGASYTVSLVVVATLLALITIPFSITTLGIAFGVPLSVSSSLVFGIIGAAMLLPLAVGVGVRRLAPAIADRLVAPLNRFGGILLIAGVVPLLFKVWPAMKGLLGNGTLLAMLVFAFLALAIGHLFGGPDPSDRPVLAMANASRHPAVAIAIVQATLPNATLVPAAVLLNLIVVACIAGPYLGWATRRVAPPPTRVVVVREPTDRMHRGGGSLGLHLGRRQDRRR
jgi:BASS family bile acid:Na+ symporter